MLKINRRPATIQDWIKMKKLEPYAKWRQTSKLENFGLMFGAQASTFSSILQSSDFSIKDCDDFIRLTHSEDVLNDLQQKARKNHERGYRGEEMRCDVECKFLAVATVMREAFLNGYEGLKTRIDREHAFALKHFYTRLWYGAVRWAPELAYMNVNANGKLEGVDKKFFAYMFSHLMNNAANAGVQSGETVFIYLGWVSAEHYMKLWNLTSKIFNTIHDSLDVYVWKPEKELMKSLINSCVHDKIRYPCEGIYHRMEPEISDIRDYKHITGYEMGEFTGKEKIKGHFYKHGEEEKVMEIKDAVEAYNKRMKRDIKYEGVPV